jgi:hypothetical protein
MLNNETVKRIEEFVYSKPRSVQEISQMLKKNWRTADRYIDEIEKQYGTIATRVFREGTRGALKIVYWSGIEKASNSVFQQKIEEQILRGRTRHDFSGFDIFQYVPEKDKKVWIKEGENEVAAGRLFEFEEILRQAKKQILFLSGNLSFINYKDKKTEVFRVIEDLVKKGISIKVVCVVDIASIKNVERLLSLNYKYGKNLIEIHHAEQPVRATIIDDKLINIKEEKEPSGRINELEKRVFIFYNITNKDWTDWLTKIFWKIFSSSITAEKRLKELEKIKP